MYHKYPVTLEKLTVEVIASSLCNKPCITPWIYYGGALMAPWCPLNLATAIAIGVPIDIPRVVLDVLEAVNELHSIGVIHGNITMEHVLLRADSTGMRASLCGLGNAQFNTGQNHNQAYTHPHRAPEVDNDGILRACSFTPAADMYAVGVLMYKLRYQNSKVLDRNIVDPAQCSAEYYEMSIFGKSQCNHGACSRPCSRAPAATAEHIYAALGGSADIYDRIVVTLLKPSPALRCTAGEAIIALAATYPVGPVSAEAVIVPKRAIIGAELVEGIKKRCADDAAAGFIIACFNNCGKTIQVTPDLDARVRKVLGAVAMWVVNK